MRASTTPKKGSEETVMSSHTASQRAIGVVIPWLGTLDYIRMLEGICERVSPRGYRVVALQAGFLQQERFHADIFARSSHQIGVRRMAGWIVINLSDIDEWITARQAEGRSVVQISPATVSDLCPYVTPDNLGGARDAATHLLALGHTRIAFIGNLANSDIALRHAGFRQALADHGVNPDNAPVASVTWRNDYWTAAAGAEATRRLIESGASFSALFAATDELARGALQELERSGRRVPHDCALVGFDDSPVAITLKPQLTTVHQSFWGVGSKAAALLLDMLEGGEVASGMHVVRGRLIVRASCGALPVYRAVIPASGNLSDPLEALVGAALHVPEPDLVPETPLVRMVFSALLDAFHYALTTDDQQIWVEALEACLATLASMLRDVGSTQRALAVLQQIGFARAPEQKSRVADLIAIAERVIVGVFVQEALLEQDRWAQLVTLVNDTLLHMTGVSHTDLTSLAWMRLTPVLRSYLFLYNDAESDDVTLSLQGACSAGVQTCLATGARCSAALFPPDEMIAELQALAMDERYIPPLTVFPVATANKLYGVMCVAFPRDSVIYRSSMAGLWASQIAILIEIERLATSVRESQEALIAAYQQERALMDTVRELSSPVLPVASGVIVMPLIGAIDANRAEQILEALLGGISQHQAQTAIIDITGVPLVDTQVAASLVQAIQAARLLGAEVILTGINPELAQTMVQLGVNAQSLTTASNLASGLRRALRRGVYDRHLGGRLY
jgi:DNA-binding LacI/PurR family transcriptional regulator/anti-anti-sigma regulatory factor